MPQCLSIENTTVPQRVVITNAPSQAWNSFRFIFDSTADGVEPVVVKIGNRPAKSLVVHTDAQVVAADFPELLKGNTVLAQDRHRLLRIFRSDGNDDAGLRFIKKHCSGRRVACFQIDLCPEKLFGIKAAFS